jgi:uncharacterized membrane protein
MPPWCWARYRNQRRSRIRQEPRLKRRLAADLCNLAAKHYQGGMHAYYFGFAACAWFAHPVGLVVAGLWVVGILYRREFRSRALAALGQIPD